MSVFTRKVRGFRVIDLGIREIQGRLEILDRDTTAVCDKLKQR